MFHVKQIKYVTPKNTQIHIIIATYDNTNEPTKEEIRTSKVNIINHNTGEEKEMRIEMALNGHLEGCVCQKCHDARLMLEALRNM